MKESDPHLGLSALKDRQSESHHWKPSQQGGHTVPHPCISTTTLGWVGRSQSSVQGSDLAPDLWSVWAGLGPNIPGLLLQFLLLSLYFKHLHIRNYSCSSWFTVCGIPSRKCTIICLFKPALASYTPQKENLKAINPLLDFIVHSYISSFHSTVIINIFQHWPGRMREQMRARGFLIGNLYLRQISDDALTAGLGPAFKKHWCEILRTIPGT